MGRPRRRDVEGVLRSCLGDGKSRRAQGKRNALLPEMWKDDQREARRERREGGVTVEHLAELKPCPFCGGRDLHMKDGYLKDHLILYSIFCHGCAGSGAWAETKEIAVISWNRRAPSIEEGQG